MSKVSTLRENGTFRVSFVPEGESKTEQSHREECNINSIVRRYQKTGALPTNPSHPHYGDFTALGDYHSCVERVRTAEETFMSLPSHIRKRFRNDPEALFTFLNREENRAEAIRLGLVVREAPAEVVEAPESPGEDDPPKVDG